MATSSQASAAEQLTPDPAQLRDSSEKRALAQPLQMPNLTELYDQLLHSLETRPYQTIAATAGVGFLLGGGLFSGLARSLIGAGLRVGLATHATPVLRELLDRVQHKA